MLPHTVSVSSIVLSVITLTLLGCVRPNNSDQESDTAFSAIDLTETESSAADTSVATDTTTFTFAFTGDVMMGTTFPYESNGAYLPSKDGASLFDDAKEILNMVDVAAGNLEGTLLDADGEPKKVGDNPQYYFVFKTPRRYVRNLVDAGYDFMGLANNHTNDFGAEGRKSTIEVLDSAGLAHAGHRGMKDFAIIERKGAKIGITQFGHSANTLNINDEQEVKRIVKEMRKECDLVVVSFHGGAEGASNCHVTGQTENYIGENRGNVKKFAHTAIDAGADIVYGHGPHVPRGVELYNEHIIFYSLGNFCTPYRMGLSGTTGYAPIAVVRVDKNGKFIEGRIHSLIQKYGVGPRLDSDNKVSHFMQTLSKQDFPSTSPNFKTDGTILP